MLENHLEFARFLLKNGADPRRQRITKAAKGEPEIKEDASTLARSAEMRALLKKYETTP